MPDAIPFFATRLILGIALSLLPVAIVERGMRPSSNVVVSPYFRIQMLLILGLASLVALTTSGPKWLSLVIAATAFVGSVLWLLDRRLGGRIAIWIILYAAAGQLIALLPDKGARFLWPSVLASSLLL